MKKERRGKKDVRSAVRKKEVSRIGEEGYLCAERCDCLPITFVSDRVTVTQGATVLQTSNINVKSRTIRFGKLYHLHDTVKGCRERFKMQHSTIAPSHLILIIWRIFITLASNFCDSIV